MKDEKNKKADEPKSAIDELFEDVKNYRRSDKFKKILEFVSTFPFQSPYNAFLVYQQMPGASYVLTAPQWKKKYGRSIKPDARPLIIMVPFGPVGFVYDIFDTYPGERNGPTLFEEAEIQDIIDSARVPFQTTGYEPKRELEALKSSLPFQGIFLNTDFISGSEYAGKIEFAHEKDQLTIRYFMPGFNYPANYRLSVRKGAETGEIFSTIAHELGHLFCHHLPAKPSDMWQQRKLSYEEKEFEAECVAYIVCRKFGVQTPSVEYLSHFFDENSEIPNISPERIFSAATTILNMAGDFKVKGGILYKKDDVFKKKFNALIANFKNPSY